MPIIRAGDKLIFYAHVPKCAGSAVETYLAQRFGQLAFEDRRHLSLPEAQRWSQTSPQHIDLAALGRLFPADFFDFSFAVVRHPVARIVSAYHFQLEREGRIHSGTDFQQWLEGLRTEWQEAPYLYDNHARPMVDLVPKDATIFHLEHGLDALIPWLDAVTGTDAGSRAMPRVNVRDSNSASAGKIKPENDSLELIAEIYTGDFDRFGYRPDDPQPLAPPPDFSEAFLKLRDRDSRRAANPLRRLTRRLFRAARR